MFTKMLHHTVAAAALCCVIGGARVLYAQDDESPSDGDLPSITMATCTGGSGSKCSDVSESHTRCDQWVPVGINGSLSPVGGGIGVTMQCGTTVTETTRTVLYWSK